jgi:hypothetical protein
MDLSPSLLSTQECRAFVSPTTCESFKFEAILVVYGLKLGYRALDVAHLTSTRWFAVAFPRLGNRLQRLPLCMRRARLRLNHPQ